MKVLVIYYSLTQQAALAADLAAEALREEGAAVTLARVDFADPAVAPQRPFSLADVKRWSEGAARGDCYPMAVQPADALTPRYDLVLLFSNTWQHHPSTPIRSLLAMPAFKALLNGTPFAVFVVSRLLWEKNADIVKREGEAAGGRCVAVDHFHHRGSSIGSLITTVFYMMSRGPQVPWPLPKFGLAERDIARIKPATRAVLAKLR